MKGLLQGSKPVSASGWNWEGGMGKYKEALETD